MTEQATSIQGRSRLFRRVYQQAQTTIASLLGPLIETLEGLGCGSRRNFATFEVAVRKVLVGFAHDPPSAPQFSRLGLPPTQATRQYLTQSFLFSLGMGQERALDAARRAVNMPKAVLAQSTTRGTGASVAPDSPAGRQLMLFFDLARLFTTSAALLRRLSDLRSTAGEAYEGNIPKGAGEGFFSWSKESYVDDGVEQTAELLAMFPEVATGVYERAGLKGVESFPPRLTGLPSADSSEFVLQLQAHLQSEARWDMVSAVGIIAAGIVLTVISAGTLGVVAGVLIGGGIGLVQGGALVVSAQSDLTFAQDASRFGAGSAQRVTFLEGELKGAWGMLLADVVTGGLLARVGGGRVVGRAIMQTVRTAAVSGAGSAIGTATNPNVWASPDTAGILLKAAVIGTVAGAGGHVAGSWLSRAGNRVILGLSRDTGPLKRGSMVKLGAKDAPSSTEGRVVSVDGDKVRVATPDGHVDFRVTDAAVVSAQYGGGGGRPIGPTVAAHSQGRRQAIIDASVQAGPNKTVIHHPKDSEFLIRHALDNPPPKDWWGLTMHGSDDGYFYVARQARGAAGEQSTVRQYYLTDEEVADIVRSSGWRQGTPVFLMVCNSGGTHTGRDAMAARLARLLNTHVLAPEFPVAPVPSAFTGSSAVHTVQPAANSMRGNPDSHYMLFNPGGREVTRFSPTNLQRAQNVFNVEEIARQATQAIRSGG